MKNKKIKIHEMKYYILYNYKSALEAIVSNIIIIINTITIITITIIIIIIDVIIC